MKKRILDLSEMMAKSIWTIFIGTILIIEISAFAQEGGEQPPVKPLTRTVKIQRDLDLLNPAAIRRAILDLMKDYPEQYAEGEKYLSVLDKYEKRLPALREALVSGDYGILREAEDILAWQRKVLLANPLLDFDKLLLIKRKPSGDDSRYQGSPNQTQGLGKFLGLPQQSSWQLHTMKDVTNWDNEIDILTSIKNEGGFETLFRPSEGRLVNEMDLYFDADKIMFSMPDEQKLWQIYELGIDGKGLRKISGQNQPDVHNFDSCYLPNGRIAYVSTAPFQGVPCNAAVNVGMTYLMDADGTNIRQLCFEQDHNFCPTVMNDGRILYLRWEYTDIPHVWARILFTMNPDGTTQREYYGSGGYWPNGIFFARPVPNHPTKVVGIVTGHHVGRVGELILFDPAQGRNSVNGVVQRIPGYGQEVKPVIEDKLTIESWPKFLHPWPLSDKYFLVACKPRPDDLWGIYLVDIFDNLLCLKEVEGYALLEPVPIRPIKRPPIIPEKVDLSRQDAIVYLQDIYAGPGLQGVPPGSVKQLRLFTYHFSYHKVAGISHRVGADGPWEPKRVLGTIPVNADGSVLSRVPANTPISIQPLDNQGQALQLMRSWMTAMPGEIVSCTGCHEKQSTVPPSQPALALQKPPSEIQSWYGPVRGFSFQREVQPVLNKYCVSCHSNQPNGQERANPDLRADQNKYVVLTDERPEIKVIENMPKNELVGKYSGVFEPSYVELRRFVRVGGFESDIRLLNPCEFHANTSPLFQMLKKGHHGVKLDTEAWNRLTTWVDLNAPCHGTWQEIVGLEKAQEGGYQRRLELRHLYGGDIGDPEIYPEAEQLEIEPIKYPEETKKKIIVPEVLGWPFDTEQARRYQQEEEPWRKTIDLGQDVTIELVRIPAGQFIMGSSEGHEDEQPLTCVEIEKSFWMSKYEISNEQYARFNPSHDSKFEHKGSWIFSENHLGWPLNQPKQPVVRISWEDALAFCQWLSKETGLKTNLPTESQWEWACRSGTSGSFYYGNSDDDFSAFANMADATIRELAYDTDGRYTMDLLPRESRYNDGQLVTAPVGTYQPNAWGLYDMHGNVWEWTRSQYHSYPYLDQDGRNETQSISDRVVRGGSWYDRPERCRSGFRLSYPPWQKVFNVGFRIIIESDSTSSLMVKNND
ncbi:MAG: SUMF1/EgtB/PvdO family nonheme iron enzyme [Phycisphaerae bacterium]|nr:SUMF1/EgtB/PvdO family nonheme iron enzyme [Phycisphaerae bacterium]